MKTQLLAPLLASLFLIGTAVSIQSQVVDVTVVLDAANVSAGGSTTLRVFAQVTPAQRTNANRIFSWYVDLLNTNGTVAAANYGAMQKATSDKDPATSSTGTQEGANRRGIYDTFMNLPGAGVSNAVELMAIPVSGLAPGSTRFRILAGTGADLSSDFLVARAGGGPPLTGGNYALADAVLTVSEGFPTGVLSISVTNAGGATNGVTISWPITAGFNFTAESRNALGSGPPWQPLAGGPHNTGRAFEYTTGTARFYRVLVEPAN